ncbi:MAG: sulfatase-like hydrolase/transferase, partial [Eubacteriales bacterium]|nr:sulfatase-like hydrolase/transferase [Eubacteriales bacterium]
LKNQFDKSDFIEEHYVDAGKVDIEFPKKKRNLIYIFLESMEMTYADIESGGSFLYNNIPEFTKIAGENQCFAGNSGLLNGGRVLPGTTFTMAGMFAQTTGLPLKVELGEDFLDAAGSFNKMNTQDKFFEGVTALGDILEDNGYKNVFMLGSDATFGGRRLYMTRHGGYELDDYRWAIDQGIISPDYYVFWGMEDQKLFSAARERLTELAASDEPFNLTLLTVDTHFEDGYRCDICPDTYGKDNYANAIACSDRQVSELVEWIKEQDFYENTTIVLCGDHTTMDSDFCDIVPASYERRVYTAFINPAQEPADPDRKRSYTTLDQFPTTLAALGCSIEGDQLGLGVNLFSDKDTLLEEYGYEEMASELEKHSDLMKELADIDVYNEDLLEAEGMLPDCRIVMDGLSVGEDTVSFRVDNVRNIYEKTVKTELLIQDSSGSSKTVEMSRTDDGYYIAQTSLSDFDCRDAAVTVRLTGKSGRVYEAGCMTGDLTLKQTNILSYLDALLANPQYTVLLAVRDDGAHSLNRAIQSKLNELGLTRYSHSNYRCSYYAVITPDGVTEEVSEEVLNRTGTLADGKEYSVMSQGGLSGAGGGAGRYLTCSIKIDGIEYAVKRIGMNIVVYDTEKSKVVDSVEFNTYMGLEAVRKDPSESIENAQTAQEQMNVASGSTAPSQQE